ncbi:MAG: tetratricopeptide repeat protein, partial [Burkholderia sp.]|nr:tetratricopeptide repeat protein [Burkholderia sp.]
MGERTTLPSRAVRTTTARMKCFYINLDHACTRRERLEAEFKAMADAQFSPRSFAIIDHLSAQAAPWDLLFTDLMILDTDKMMPFAARYPRLVGERGLLIEDLATTAFAGSSAYLVRRASKARVLDVLESAGLDLPYDLRLRQLFGVGELSGRVCIPLVTTVSPEAEDSQIADLAFAQSLKQTALQLFRRLMFFDRDIAALELTGAQIAARADDAHSRLCGVALGAIIAQTAADEMSDHLASLASLGRIEEAEAGLRALLAAQPEHPRARMNLAQVLLAQGRYPEAAPYYEARHAVREGARPKPDFPYPEWAG